MHVWSQTISLGFAAVAFGVSLMSRKHDEIRTPEGALVLRMWTRLFKFPVFWFGLLLLGYILIQALNSQSEYVVNAYLSYGRPLYTWWLKPLGYIEWLPTSVAAPMVDSEMSPWRMLMIYGSAWLVACALWVGITRRASIRILLTVFVINGTVFAGIGIAQRLLNSTDMLWLIPAPKYAPYWFASIVYKNHAAAYMNLVAAISTGLMYWHFTRKGISRSRPTPLFAFFNIILGIAIFITQSRGGFFLFAGYTIFSLIVIFGHCVLHRGEGNSRLAVFGVIGGIFIIGTLLAANLLDLSKYLPRYQNLLEKGAEDQSYVVREKTTEITLAMADDNLVFGSGAGSFRYIFPSYAKRMHPEVMSSSARQHVRRWEFAHNDYVQFLAEFGIVGSSIAVLLLGSGLVQLLRRRFFRHTYIMLIFFGLLVTLAHCWVDFQSHNPAILLLWCATAAMLVRWSEFEESRRRSPA